MTGAALSLDLLAPVLDLTDRAEPAPSGRATVDPGPRAAVAVVFRAVEPGTAELGAVGPRSVGPGAGSGPVEVLLIQRAAHDRDPWSGHMAFPGGRVDVSDPTTHHTAERETREELGLDLSAATVLGSLTEMDAGRAVGQSLTVSAHCYALPGPRPALAPNHEVADAQWLALDELLAPSRWIRFRHPGSGGLFPGIQLDADHQVVWGLTLRFLGDLFRRLGRPFAI